MEDKECIFNIEEEFIFDLQFFASPEAEGRTEEPTERRKQKAREKGQVARSQELSQDLVSLVCFFMLSFFLPYIFNEFREFAKFIFGEAYRLKISEVSFYNIVLQILILFFKCALPVMGVAFIVSLVANIAQVGWKITLQPLKPDFTKISLNPKKLINKVFSTNALEMFLKSVAKVIVIAYFAYRLIRKEYDTLILLPHMGIYNGIAYVLKVAYKLVMQTMAILLIISIFDYFWQKRQHRRSLMMTKQEVKDEMKQIEGDPLIKSRIRERQRQMATRRMMAEVPKAEVVITNPTHLSVALMYEAEYMNAPKIIAKGAGFIALRIREVATAHGIPLVENKPLAQALYKDVEIGEEIPVELYHAVAEVLSFVYRLKKKVAGV